jgi:hypothetical protein
MPRRPNGLLEKARRLWFAVNGRREPEMPDVIVHDPAATRPRDLDDPFFDTKVQSRIGDTIAQRAQKSQKR